MSFKSKNIDKIKIIFHTDKIEIKIKFDSKKWVLYYFNTLFSLISRRFVKYRSYNNFLILCKFNKNKTNQKLFSVIRSPFVHRKSMEQFATFLKTCVFTLVVFLSRRILYKRFYSLINLSLFSNLDKIYFGKIYWKR